MLEEDREDRGSPFRDAAEAFCVYRRLDRSQQRQFHAVALTEAAAFAVWRARSHRPICDDAFDQWERLDVDAKTNLIPDDPYAVISADPHLSEVVFLT